MSDNAIRQGISWNCWKGNVVFWILTIYGRLEELEALTAAWLSGSFPMQRNLILLHE